MFVLGIDPGLTRTGYGVATRSGGRVRAVAAGVIRTSSDDSIEQRLATLAQELRSIIDEHEPTAVALETVFTNRNRQTAISVGRASGVALLVAGEAGVPVTEYTPTAIKLAVTGSGSADKQAMQQMVARRYGLKEAPRPADAADALGIALCHLQSINLRQSS
jgi:crossover junction endodeoxyribonuclease RuvC